MGRRSVPRAQWLVLGGLLLLLVALCLGAIHVTSRLIPSMGVVVFAAGLFLPPAMTALVGCAALALAVPVAATLDEAYEQVRTTNLLVAAVLAVAASWFLDRRISRIEDLRRSEAAVLASIPDAVIVLDPEGRLLQANAGLTRLVPDAVEGAVLHPLLGHLLADGSACPGGCPLGGHPPETPSDIPVEGEQITRDGRPLPVAYTTGRVVERGIVVSLRDVSSRVRAEQDRRVLLEEAARQREQTLLLRALEAPPLAALPDVPGLVSDIWSTGTAKVSISDHVDVSTLADGRVLILLVDSDHEGARSMRDSWLVLHVCRAHMAAGAPLGEMIALCAGTLDWEEETPSAVILAVLLNPSTGHLQAAMGGAPPPLLVRAQGPAEWLEAAGHGIGSSRPGSQSVASAELNPGDSLVLYSAGAVEGSRDLVEGLSLLRSTAVALRRHPVAGWARRALEALNPQSPVGREATLVMVRLGTPE